MVKCYCKFFLSNPFRVAKLGIHARLISHRLSVLTDHFPVFLYIAVFSQLQSREARSRAFFCVEIFMVFEGGYNMHLLLQPTQLVVVDHLNRVSISVLSYWNWKFGDTVIVEDGKITAYCLQKAVVVMKN